MYANKNIVKNAVNSRDHTTLVSAVQAAGLIDTLKGDGPFTVFAPANMDFEKLPVGTVDMLLKSNMKDQLAGVLTYHVAAGCVTAEDLTATIKNGGGTFNMTTVEGSPLTAQMSGEKIAIIDESGNGAHVTVPNVLQPNGTIHGLRRGASAKVLISGPGCGRARGSRSTTVSSRPMISWPLNGRR